jgi:hypothetical protein
LRLYRSIGEATHNVEIRLDEPRDQEASGRWREHCRGQLLFSVPGAEGWHLGQKQVPRFCTGTRSPGPPTAPMSHAAPEKVVMFCISTVVLPVPPSEVACPLVSVSEKELLTASKDSLHLWCFAHPNARWKHRQKGRIYISS